MDTLEATGGGVEHYAGWGSATETNTRTLNLLPVVALDKSMIRITESQNEDFDYEISS